MDAKRERYTPNDVGPSPLDWTAPRLSEVSTLITNGFVGTATPFYTDSSGVPYLYGTNVRANKLEDNRIRYVTREFHESQSKTALKVGDLLTVQSGHIGETAVVTEQFEGANCHALIVTRLKQNKACPEYLSYYVNSEIGRARMKGLEVGSTILHINTKDLKKFRVLLPSLPEQKKIAQLLSTWDKAISTTEQLLANSQQQKKALMQQLLTGKKRLHNHNGQPFNGEWKDGHLSDIAKINKGKALSSKDLIEGTYPVIAGGKTSPYTHNEYTHENIITVSASGAYAGFVAYHPNKIWASDCSVVSAKTDSCTTFIFFLMQSQQNKIYSLQSGGAQPHIYPKDLEVLKVAIPKLEEQQKIAAVLTSADNEIDTLKQKLDHLKQEKKALMQQLLTGKRRVKVNEKEVRNGKR